MKKKTIIVTVIAVLIVIAIIGSALFLLSQPRLVSEVKVGAIIPLTGPFASYGTLILDGMRFAVDEINAKGGVLGARLILIEADDKNDAKESVLVFKRLVEVERVVAIVGGFSTTIAMALAPEAEQAKHPLILPGGASHKILTRESRFTFRTCLPPTPSYGEMTANFIRDQNFKRVGAIIAGYEWGYVFRDALEPRLKQLGVKYQFEEAPVGETDFTTVLRKLQPLDPDVMILIGHPPGSVTIIKQAIELGFNSKYYVISIMPAEALVRGVGDIGIGKVALATCLNSESPEYKELAQKFYQKYGKYFDVNAVIGYVSIMLISNAIEKTRSTDPITIANYIRTSEFKHPAFAWPLSYTEWGELKNLSGWRLALLDRGDPGPINPGAKWILRTLYESPPIPPYVPEK
jgi:branched-chain amino acid transport system substrate-binding protein